MAYNSYSNTSGKFTEAAILLISHSISTIITKQTAIKITKTTELTYLIKENTQVAKFSVVTPEQSKFIRSVDTAIFSLIPESDPDMSIQLSEILRTNKPEQQKNTFSFPTPENPGNVDDHTPIQTRILKELRELQGREQLNQKGDGGS